MTITDVVLKMTQAMEKRRVLRADFHFMMTIAAC